MDISQIIAALNGAAAAPAGSKSTSPVSVPIDIGGTKVDLVSILAALPPGTASSLVDVFLPLAVQYFANKANQPAAAPASASPAATVPIDRNEDSDFVPPIVKAQQASADTPIQLSLHADDADYFSSNRGGFRKDGKIHGTKFTPDDFQSLLNGRGVLMGAKVYFNVSASPDDAGIERVGSFFKVTVRWKDKGRGKEWVNTFQYDASGKNPAGDQDTPCLVIPGRYIATKGWAFILKVFQYAGDHDLFVSIENARGEKSPEVRLSFFS